MQRFGLREWTLAILIGTAIWPANAQTERATPAIAPKLGCERLTEFKVPNSNVVISKAEAVAEAAPNTVRNQTDHARYGRGRDSPALPR